MQIHWQVSHNQAPLPNVNANDRNAKFMHCMREIKRFPGGVRLRLVLRQLDAPVRGFHIWGHAQFGNFHVANNLAKSIIRTANSANSSILRFYFFFSPGFWFQQIFSLIEKFPGKILRPWEKPKKFNTNILLNWTQQNKFLAGHKFRSKCQ